MITFKQFLNESRSKVVSVEQFIRWADANASVYMNGPTFFYRGNTGDAKKGIRIGNAAGADVTPRESANTYNNYTLWIDNHPSFKGWPKRSRSWVATDDREMAESFSGPMLLIIHDEAQVGIVGQRDLWETDLPGSKMTIEELNGITHSIIDSNPKTYEALVEIMKNYELEDIEQIKYTDDVYNLMVKKKLKNLYEVWEYLVKPEIFAGKTTGARAGDKPSHGEVWIEGEVAFIPHVQRLSESDAERLKEWVDQYQELAAELEDFWGSLSDDPFE